MQFVEVKVGLMDEDEVEELIDLEYEVLGASPFVRLSTLPVWKKAIVARADGIVGCATFFWGDRFSIASLAVRSSYRGNGIGRTILRKCFEVAREMGYNSVWLETPVDGPVAFYLSEGFRIEEVLKDYYGNGVDGLKLVRIL